MDFDDMDETLDEEMGESMDIADTPDEESMDTELDIEDTGVGPLEASDLAEEVPELPVETSEETDLTQSADFQEWAQAMDFLDEPTQIAVYKDAAERSPVETELADAAYHPEFEPQLIFKTDAETGEVLRDTDGNFVMDSHRSSGTQAPDLFRQDESGDIYLIEDRNYSDIYNLERNITEQTAARRAAFGDDVDITYNVAPKFSVKDAEHLQNYLENVLGVNLTWSD